VSIINSSHLMLFKEIITVCCKNHVEHVEKRCGQNADFIEMHRTRFIFTAMYSTVKVNLKWAEL